MSEPIVSGCSPLATYYNDAKYYDRSGRTNKIDTITIHCVVGQWTAEFGCDYFARIDRQASCNYFVGKDGSIGICVPEGYRSYCTSDGANDNRAVTIETASDTSHPYAVTDEAYNALINLIADICQRNNIKKLVWSTNKDDRIAHKNGCNMTVHRDYKAKACPGQYLYDRHGDIANKVNNLLVPVISSCDTTINKIDTTKVSAKISVSDNYENYSWSYSLKNLKTDEVVTKSFKIKTKTHTLNINNLYPNNKYYLEIIAKHDNSTMLNFPAGTFTTLQDYPKSVKDINLSIKDAESHIISEWDFLLSFKEPESWGDFVDHRKAKGYRISLILNGRSIYQDNTTIKYGTNSISFKLRNFVDLDNSIFTDTLQIGIQTWVTDENSINIFDSDFPVCSKPIYLKHQSDMVDKVYLTVDNKIKRAILFCNNKE
jgi:hypothetical protein